MNVNNDLNNNNFKCAHLCACISTTSSLNCDYLCTFINCLCKTITNMLR